MPTLHRVARGLAVDKKSMPKFVLSDLYPLVKDWKRLQQELGEDCLGYIDAPVSIAQVPETVSRHWTIFSAFHHLPPSLARQLMQQVFEKANSLHIAETTRRHWLNILSVLLNAPILILAPFFANRFSFAKLVITTLIRKRSTPPHQLSQDLC